MGKQKPKSLSELLGWKGRISPKQVQEVQQYYATRPPDLPPTQEAPAEPTYQTQDFASQDVGGAAAPAPALATSPEWQAFLASLGIEQSQFEGDIGRQRGVAQSLAAQQAADITAQGPGQRRNIAGSAETRGMARSGQLVRSLAEERAQEGRAQGGVQAGLTGTLSNLESQLSNKLIDLGSRRAQQELQLRSQGYV
jgi:hypothetical protein